MKKPVTSNQKPALICAILFCAVLFSTVAAAAEEREIETPISASVSSGYRPERIIVADFESSPSCYLNTREESWGSAYPDSRRIGVFDPQFNPANVHTGAGSFKLVNGFRSKKNWGCFSMNLGPVTDITKDPIGIRALDVSTYLFFTFWVKGAQGGERFRVIFRDAQAENYMPVTIFTPDDNIADAKWKKIILNMSEVQQKLEGYVNRPLDLSQLVAIGIEVGDDVGNNRGNTIYVDDIEFTK